MGLAAQTGRNWNMLGKGHQKGSVADLPRMTELGLGWGGNVVKIFQ